MRELVTLKSEMSGQIIAEEWDFLDRGNDGGINSLLISLLVVRALGLGLGGIISNEEAIGSLGLAGSLGLLEVSIVDVFGDGDTSDVHTGGGGNHEALVDAAEANTVDLVRASDEEKTRLELLQEHDALSAEATSENDENGASSDGLAEFLGFAGERSLFGSNLGTSNVTLDGVITRVEARSALRFGDSAIARLFCYSFSWHPV